MAENNQEHDQDEFQDAYEYEDLDMGSEQEPGSEDTQTQETSGSMLDRLPVNKEMLVRIGYLALAFIVILIIYKVLGGIFRSKPPAKPVAIQQPILKPAPLVMAPGPVISSAPSPEITQKLSNLQSSEDKLNNDFASLNNQVTGISSSVGDLSNKVDQLSQAVNLLAAQLAEQSRQITLLTARQHDYVRVKKVSVTNQKVSQKLVYFLQAVIPGRAWIISNAGNTLTVRDGSRVPGYGVIKRIDPNEGRLLTSSGRIIVFSQLDS